MTIRHEIRAAKLADLALDLGLPRDASRHLVARAVADLSRVDRREHMQRRLAGIGRGPEDGGATP